MGGQYEIKDGAAKKYYSIAGMMVAVNDGTGLQYLLTDHLGSTVAVTNASGTLTSQQRYLPFGEARTIPNSPILATDFTYTGQRLLDPGMGGIMDYKARFYSPYLNHFTQPDTIVSDPYNPQAWNRFSYAFNNPIRYNDPDGHCPVCAIPLIDLALMAVIVTVAYYIIVPPPPELVEGVERGLDSISNSLKRWQQNTANKRQGESIERSSHTTGDNNLGPGYGYKPPKCGFFCWLGIGTGTGFLACVLMFEEKCVNAASSPNSEITPTPTQTMTPTSTVTPTSTSTSTPTQTPPALTPGPPRRDDRLLVAI
jgi:RHS repeat-associated protein